MTEPSRLEEINHLVSRQQPGFTLERPFYTHSDIFELEANRVFSRIWFFAGHASRIRQAGDYYQFNVAGESLLIIRDDAGEIHALFNVCRHRGSRLCANPDGQLKKLVCPYHAWVYDKDGRLLAAKHMPDNFDSEDYGLQRCAVRIVEGLIFICLSPNDAPDFDPQARELEELYRPHGFGRAKIAHTQTYRIKSNWKIVYENAWECYHCSHAHPEYCSVMPYATAFESSRRLEERNRRVSEWEAFASSIGHHLATNVAEKESKHDIFIYRGPIRSGYLTESIDGQPVAPLMGGMKQYDGGISGYMTLPLIWFVAASDHALLTRFTPINALETEAQYCWLVDGDAVAGVDYQIERLTHLWRATAEQDVKICEENQAGVMSRSYLPGPYSTAELGADRFIRWYLAKLSEA